MKDFIIKYKLSIIYCLIITIILFYFEPKETQHYLDYDIKSFKSKFLSPILIWSGLAISLIIWILRSLHRKSFVKSIPHALIISGYIAFFLFVFQNIFLTSSLFINRQFKRNNFEKMYLTNYLNGSDQSKESFFPYTLPSKQITTDKKLKNKLYHVELRQGDTIYLKFERGLLGILFQEESFIDE